MKTDFINNMTHEFKTPIATISLASDSITNQTVISNPDKIKRFAGIIKQENTRMLNQVEKVLQMAKIDKKDFELKLTQVNMHDVIRQAAVNTRLKLGKRNGTLEVTLDATNSIIEGDMTHISNIIHNLLDNAEKYSNEVPQIVIKTLNISGGIEVDIKDNGIGMTQDSIKHIFDKFYRVHTGNRHDVKGFGLGLSYVKALMDAHNGRIKVKSELGSGSTFSLFFPFLQSD
jgi:two-component system phosphate regulon sensor histidine kinase PhoR